MLPESECVHCGYPSAVFKEGKREMSLAASFREAEVAIPRLYILHHMNAHLDTKQTFRNENMLTNI